MYISAVKLFESKYEKKKSIYLSKICSLAVVATSSYMYKYNVALTG